MGDFKGGMKKLKHFIFDDDSVWSWLFDIVVAFVLIKFIVYPALGFMLSTTHPIVAVVSGSMEHDGSYDEWWSEHEAFYLELGITKEGFRSFPFPNGFNTGDIMVLRGKPPSEIEIGDVIVYQGGREPIIHRVVDAWYDDGHYYFRAKGDHNSASLYTELKVRDDQVIGFAKHGEGSTALLRVPFLGYIKIAAVKLLQIIGVV